MTTDTQPNWMTPIKKYLTNGICDPHLEKTMKRLAARFVLIDKDLYRRGVHSSALKMPNTRPHHLRHAGIA